MDDFKSKLDNLVNSAKISKKKYHNFLQRGIQYQKFDSEFPTLRRFFPDGVPIGASDTFIRNLSFPYQETSYVCASIGKRHPRTYLYKLHEKHGGVLSLLDGIRPIGDNLFGSLNRILLGSDAILLSADNLIANMGGIWDWRLFGNHLKKNNFAAYDELEKFSKTYTQTEPTHVILARKKETFERLHFLEKYKKNQIAIFNSDHVKIIIMTNYDGYDYVSRVINPGERINYVVEIDETGNIDIKKCLQVLRTKFGISRMLNDGGRKMSNGMKQLGLLGGERISYEPSPAEHHIPKIITEDMILGRDGLGIDGSAVKDSFIAYSQNINTSKQETFNLHLYTM